MSSETAHTGLRDLIAAILRAREPGTQGLSVAEVTNAAEDEIGHLLTMEEVGSVLDSLGADGLAVRGEYYRWSARDPDEPKDECDGGGRL